MPKFETGEVVLVLDARGGMVKADVKLGRRKRRAVGFLKTLGPLKKGDKVVVNTTAVELGLGTGGEDFILWNLSHTKVDSMSEGHILKLRYTPWQQDVMVAEAPESPHHQAFEDVESLNGMPVVCCGLHSQVAPAVAMLKHTDPDLKVAYLMTDGGALPIAHSDLIAGLAQKELIDVTVTCGHAFGGDLETVNIFSGLIAASEILRADVAVVSIGPGIVGTKTLFGHTGMEQGQAVSAAAALGGRPVAAARISFADERRRHNGLSRQTVAALRYGTTARCTIAVPDMDIGPLNTVMADLTRSGLAEMHDVLLVDAWETGPAMAKQGLDPTTMGRSFDEDSHFFESAGAAGLAAARLIYEME